MADNVLSFGKPLTTYLSHVRGPPPTASQQGLTHRSTPKTSPSHTMSHTPPPHSPQTLSMAQQQQHHHVSSQKTASSMSNFSLGPTSPSSPSRHGIYSSSQCYTCFVEYSRYEMYDETLHSDAPEVDGVEISVYGVGR